MRMQHPTSSLLSSRRTSRSSRRSGGRPFRGRASEARLWHTSKSSGTVGSVRMADVFMMGSIGVGIANVLLALVLLIVYGGGGTRPEGALPAGLRAFAG